MTRETRLKVTVSGIYAATSENSDGLVKKPYSKDFLIPLDVQEWALSYIIKYLIKPNDAAAMREDYPDYVHYHTHEITHVEEIDIETGEIVPSSITSGRKPFSIMSREELDSFCKAERLRVNVSLYPNLADYRDAVALASKDPFTYEKHEEAREKNFGNDIRNQKKASEDTELLKKLKAKALKPKADKGKKVTPPATEETPEPENNENGF